MSQYTDQEQIEQVLQRSLSADEVAILEVVIEAVSAAINEHTDRLWFDFDDDGSGAEATSKLYDGNGQRELFIDDFTTLTSVQLIDIDGSVVSTLEDTYLVSYPLNQSWKNSVYWRAGIFTRGRANVKVTAIFYTGVLPPEVKLAAATLAGLAFNNYKDQGIYKRESIEGYSRELMTSEDVTAKERMVFTSLDKWRKVYV